MIRRGILRTCTCLKIFSNSSSRSFGHFSNDIWNEDLSLDVKLRIENHWKEKLSKSTFDSKNVNNKFYVLSMFPYPSGRLHMGHVRIYVIADSISRFHRMNGQNVFQPMGWDAFGLPAENAAMSHGLAADEWTFSNIQYMKEQLMQLGCSFDWSNEISTCDPTYYKWTQWIFLKMFESGLVYSKEAEVNWDPVDKTVLANEQVDENGHSWRSGAKVEKKILKQWFIRTTKFSKALYDGLNDSSLIGWRDIINLQKHWIGECDGYIFDFNLYTDNVYRTVLNIWTSQPEHIPLCAFLCIKPNSFIHKHYVVKSKQIFIKNCINDKMLPILVTNEVEYPDNKDVRLAIPLVYEKDKELARKNNIPYEDSASVKNMSKEAVCEKAKQLNMGGYPVSSKLQDWLISRQRYWGTPVPIIHCKKCGQQCVPEEQLPVMLPVLNVNCDKNFKSLKNAENWIKTNCPKCGGEAARETDTMDTFVDSSWYFLRYLDPKNKYEPFDKNIASKFMPVDIYVGGKEHAVLHLYYARFVNYFLHSINLVPHPEPFKNLLVQGMVMGQSFKDKTNGHYLKQDQVEKKGNKYFTKNGNHPVTTVWEKMSKSKHNGVEPSSTLQEYGVDTMRLLILSSVAPTSNRNWNSDTFPGVLNWQQKLWSIIKQFRHIRSSSLQKDSIDSSKFHDEQIKLYEARNYYVKKTSSNYRKSYQLSVAISFLQGLTNVLKKSSKEHVKYSAEYERLLAVQIIMLAPMAPHFASALWNGFVSAPGRINSNWTQIKWEEDVIDQSWPKVDDSYELSLYCLVNNAVKCVLKIPKKELKELTEQKALEIALKQDIILEYTSLWNILGTTFQMYEDDDGYLNIKTDRKSESKEKTEND